MKKLVLLTLLLLLTAPCLRAQRKEMSQARSYIKSGKTPDKAEKLMRELLDKDSVNRHNPKIYLLLYQAIRKQYEAGNEKLYLKQGYDTAAIFNLTKRMFDVLEALDSLDAAPDIKGNVRLEYRRRHSQELDAYRPNLYYGGTYYMTKSDFSLAFSFFDKYIDCAFQPLFSDYDYAKTDKRMAEVAYLATFCGFKMGNPDRTLKHSELAMRNAGKRENVLRYMAEALRLRGDSCGYMDVLRKGFHEAPENPYFFPRLIDYYTGHDMLDSAMVYIDAALQKNNRNELFLLAKSTVLLNSRRYKECIVYSDSLIQLNDTLADAYFNAGTSYMNQALALEGQKDSRFKKEQVRKLYQCAKPYMEEYRRLVPEDVRKWGPVLYKIYLNLNLGKQFDEIDKVLNKR